MTTVSISEPYRIIVKKILIFLFPFQENGILSNQLKNAQFKMQSLPSNSHTMQAMLEAKVRKCNLYP